MKNIKKIISGISLIAIASTSPSQLNADSYMVDAGGGAYERVHSACYIIPAAAMAAGLIALIIVVGASNGSSVHSH